MNSKKGIVKNFATFIKLKVSFCRLLILLPVLSSLIGQAQDDGPPFDVVAQAWKNIKATIHLIQQDRVASLAGRVVYPLIRENPLHDISNQREFAQAYKILFDSTLKMNEAFPTRRSIRRWRNWRPWGPSSAWWLEIFWNNSTSFCSASTPVRFRKRSFPSAVSSRR